MVHFLLKHEITTTYIPEVLVKMQMGGMDPLAQTPPQSSPIPSTRISKSYMQWGRNESKDQNT